MKDYILRLCLDSPLYFKFIQFQLEKKLGKSYAGLIVFLEGMKALGLIDNDIYVYYQNRYDKPLETSPIIKEMPKCDFCGKAGAVAIAIHQSGITKKVCEKHLKDLKNHPKWSIMRNES